MYKILQTRTTLIIKKKISEKKKRKAVETGRLMAILWSIKYSFNNFPYLRK